MPRRRLCPHGLIRERSISWRVASSSSSGKIERVRLKPLLYQLSYVGASGKDQVRRFHGQAPTCSQLTVRSAARQLQTRALRGPTGRRLQRQHKCLTNLAQCDAPRFSAQRVFETFDRFSKRLETESESLMMHRHDKLRAGSVCHFNRLLRRAMRSDPRIVSTDRHDREIDGAALTQFGKTVRQRGVPGKKNASSISFQEIAVVSTVSVALLPRTPVFHA